MALARFVLQLACLQIICNGEDLYEQAIEDRSSSQRMTKALVALSGDPDVAKLWESTEERGLQGRIASTVLEFDKDATMRSLIENITKYGLQAFQKADSSLKKAVLERFSYVELPENSMPEADVADAKAVRIRSMKNNLRGTALIDNAMGLRKMEGDVGEAARIVGHRSASESYKPIGANWPAPPGAHNSRKCLTRDWDLEWQKDPGCCTWGTQNANCMDEYIVRYTDYSCAGGASLEGDAQLISRMQASVGASSATSSHDLDANAIVRAYIGAKQFWCMNAPDVRRRRARAQYRECRPGASVCRTGDCCYPTLGGLGDFFHGESCSKCAERKSIRNTDPAQCKKFGGMECAGRFSSR
jgi:hypothetical protein